MVTKHDDYTRTVEGAREHAEYYAEPGCDDRPTENELAREAEQERWQLQREDALRKVADAIDELAAIDEDAAIQLDNLVSDLEKNP